ncbi:MAG TPA: prenyltransferase [Polyangiaceae bacterium]|nr:prenyltransferase [Polyangiaceae bacterium]
MNASDTIGQPVPKPRAWAAAMRLPFTSVAVVPFGVGAWLAHAHGRMTSASATVAGLLAVFLMTIGCYLLGEAHDQVEDVATLKYGRNKFSGGSLMVSNGSLQERQVRLAALGSFVVALLLGLYVVVVHSAPWLLGLGVFGGIAAAFYSMPPVRLVKRGFGELFIGVCYGWLTIVTGYASASGGMPTFGHYVTLPVALTVFNIILINEFPDYEADREAGKRNLLVRIGKRAGAVVYALAMVATAAVFVVIWHAHRGGSLGHGIVAAAPGAWALWLAFEVGVLRAYEDRGRLESVAARTIVLNLASAICVGVLVR